MRNKATQYFSVSSVVKLTMILALCGDVMGLAPGVEVFWQDDYDRMEKELALWKKRASSDAAMEFTYMDRNCLVLDSDRDALDIQIRRLEALQKRLKQMAPSLDLTDETQELNRLKDASTQTPPGNANAEKIRQGLYRDARVLCRAIAFKNPLLDFDAILFNTFEHQIEKNNIMNHDQDVGYSAAPGGGIGILKDFKTESPSGRDLLAGVRITNGPWRGLEISAARGSFNSVDLSFDGKRIVFAWSRRGENPWETWQPYKAEFWTHENTFHLFTHEIGTDVCTQITFGNRSDHSPCWLPDGRIAFMSERRNASARCAASRHQPTSTLYAIDADGDHLIWLSRHDTEEWDPSVTNDGMLVYTRWDYLDRDFHAAHHIWNCYPDGRNPRSFHGNYPLPHTTLTGERWEDGRAFRPWGEYNIRAIPGSTQFIAIAGGHHYTGIYGAPILLNLAIPDDNRNAQITRITPGIRWINEGSPPNQPGGKTRSAGGNRREDCLDETHYGYPWPLSEDFYLVTEGEKNCRRIFLLDTFGNRVLIYSGFEIPNVSGLRAVSPRPFRPRTRPPIIPVATTQRERDDERGSTGTILVMNVYEADFEWPEDTRITALRVIQHIPKPWSSPVTEKPRLGYAQSPTGRVVLGVAPVESDGSAHFEAPAGKLLYFQALDETGMAIQSMRSGTYLHPGETLSCVGCHEDKWKAPDLAAFPRAMTRPPSRLEPEVGGVEPVNFHRLVRPVFERRCVGCHQERQAKPDFSYDSLEPYAFYFHADGGDNHMSWLHGGSRTVAGKFGARWARMIRGGYLKQSHYGVELTEAERRRIVLWLDTNSLELPSFSLDKNDQARARRGELVWPLLDGDPPSRENTFSGRP